MTTNTNVQQSPYLRLQRNFPEDSMQALTIELDRFHVDAAIKINDREIATYPVNTPIVNGQKWFLSGQPQKQQALRQVYTFTTAGNIPHGIDFKTVTLISPLSYGSYTDGVDWYGVIFATTNEVPGQVSFCVTPTNILVIRNVTAPPIVQGYIVLEWVSQF